MAPPIAELGSASFSSSCWVSQPCSCRIAGPLGGASALGLVNQREGLRVSSRVLRPPRVDFSLGAAFVYPPLRRRPPPLASPRPACYPSYIPPAHSRPSLP